MANKKEVTAPVVSALHTELLSSPSPLAKELQYVGANTEQPSNVNNNSISKYPPKNNSKVLVTVSMTELYDKVYPSKLPLIDGLSNCLTLLQNTSYQNRRGSCLQNRIDIKWQSLWCKS